MFVILFIVTQINSQVYGSINKLMQCFPNVLFYLGIIFLPT